MKPPLTFSQIKVLAYQQEFEKLTKEERAKWIPDRTWDVHCMTVAAKLYAEERGKSYAMGFQVWLWENKYEPIYDGQTFMCQKSGVPKSITELYENYKNSN